MSTLETRLAKLEAQCSGPGVFVHYPDKPFAVECATGRCVALEDVPENSLTIEIVYASLADVQSAGRGYLAADTPEALEAKAAELSSGIGPVKGYIGVSPEDWDATERATTGAD